MLLHYRRHEPSACHRAIKPDHVILNIEMGVLTGVYVIGLGAVKEVPYPQFDPETQHRNLYHPVLLQDIADAARVCLSYALALATPGEEDIPGVGTVLTLSDVLSTDPKTGWVSVIRQRVEERERETGKWSRERADPTPWLPSLLSEDFIVLMERMLNATYSALDIYQHLKIKSSVSRLLNEQSQMEKDILAKRRRK
ncbi:hypothetical protein KIPB_010116 [Kipferlia bialata]|uniref:Uncharacterized protein n=1 Tax=Kipferlia bialata TaxID=797122 RepID=A0A9K3D2M2_9EUKA|nr:hypothetical protein KIPB_010116 [Kipferlia bialata]|eukprot:g10116.t1